MKALFVIRKRLLTLSVLLGVMLNLNLSAQSHTAGDGFVKLLNEKNFDGLYLKIRSGDSTLAKKVYTADKGTIHVFKSFPDGYQLNVGNNETHGLVYTKKKYSKYILKFEYKWGKKRLNNFDQFQYDAGCYYHVYDDAIWPKGVEYQIRYDHTKNRNHTGDYWASNTSFQWFSKDSVTFLQQSEGGVKMPLKGGEHRAVLGAPFNALNNKWNKCEVIVMGNHYSIHKLNGMIVNMATNLSVEEGVIGWQSETAEILYRNIMIKEFDKIVPIEEFLK